MKILMTVAILAVVAIGLVLGIPATKVSPAAAAQTPSGPTVDIRVPERFRLLNDQQFDLRIEATNISSLNSSIRVLLDNADVTASLPAPEVTTDNDADSSSNDTAWTYRKVSIPTGGIKTLQAIVTDDATNAAITATTRIAVQEFELKGNKNIVLFIGDAMGTAYRDVSRIVAKSTNNRFREGFFDELQEMDQMPVTGMVMTYASNNITPDSANTASAWASGNKTINGALGAFPDNTDAKFSRTAENTPAAQSTKQFALDNPRVETLWEYLKRRHGYKTGIVTTSEVTDATPAGQGGHTITRALQNEIAKQYVDGVFTNGPTFDVIMGGAKERFDSRTVANSGDTRNLVNELRAAGFTYVQTRTELNALGEGAAAPDKVIGLFRTGNMNVAYDKLGLPRPADEPQPNFAGFTDQPFLDEMTDKAVAALSKNDSPYILMVESASIDKQSHPNDATGQIWDTIEFDRSVGVVRNLINSDDDIKASTLALVSADHDQSMVIIGAATGAGPVLNVRSPQPYPNPGSVAGETDGFPDYKDDNGDGYPEADTRNGIRVAVGYRTGNHTGSSVPITAEGAGAILFTGYFDQTDIFFKMARVLSTNTAALDAALVEKEATQAIGFNY